MKCPLFTVGGYDDNHVPRFGWNDCLQEECAWWDAERSRCALLTLTRQLENLCMIFEDIRDKMPHERGYVK